MNDLKRELAPLLYSACAMQHAAYMMVDTSILREWKHTLPPAQDALSALSALYSIPVRLQTNCAGGATHS
jgi:hypothetical protein